MQPTKQKWPELTQAGCPAPHCPSPTVSVRAGRLASVLTLGQTLWGHRVNSGLCSQWALSVREAGRGTNLAQRAVENS